MIQANLYKIINLPLSLTIRMFDYTIFGISLVYEPAI